nr:immunoglobulin light chain junction region [Macaca mulatta]
DYSCQVSDSSAVLF